MNATNYSAGVGQISKTVWGMYSNLPYDDAADPKYYKQNLEVAAKYLRYNYERFGSWKLAMLAYNAGPTKLSRVLHGQGQLSAISVAYVSGIQ